MRSKLIGIGLIILGYSIHLTLGIETYLDEMGLSLLQT